MQETLLRSLLPGLEVHVMDSVDSTNEEAKRLLLAGAPCRSLVAASRQTAGRGRMGRSFFSGPGGVYLSLVLPFAPAGQVTTLCAVSVLNALESVCGIRAQVKWVNDVLVQGRKVCGILCEGVWSGAQPLGLVAGIGLNVCQDLPPELRATAASLYPPGASRPRDEAIAAAICREISAQWAYMPAHMALYRSRCVTLGASVQWQTGGVWAQGRALDVLDDGSLQVRLPDGETRRLFSGEVSMHGTA